MGGAYDRFKNSEVVLEPQIVPEPQKVEVIEIAAWVPTEEEKERLRQGMRFCDYYGIKTGVPSARSFLGPPTDEQIEALKRFGEDARDSNKGQAQVSLNKWMMTARELVPRVWLSDEEIMEKLMQTTEHMRAVAEHDVLRDQCIDLLGGVCMECGDADKRVLQIDHIRDDGAQARSYGFQGEKLYRDVLERGSRGYQILCCKHNWLKRLAALERVKAAK